MYKFPKDPVGESGTKALRCIIWIHFVKNIRMKRKTGAKRLQHWHSSINAQSNTFGISDSKVVRCCHHCLSIEIPFVAKTNRCTLKSALIHIRFMVSLVSKEVLALCAPTICHHSMSSFCLFQLLMIIYLHSEPRSWPPTRHRE